jgi:hypothetical protein
MWANAALHRKSLRANLGIKSPIAYLNDARGVAIKSSCADVCHYTLYTTERGGKMERLVRMVQDWNKGSHSQRQVRSEEPQPLAQNYWKVSGTWGVLQRLMLLHISSILDDLCPTAIKGLTWRSV